MYICLQFAIENHKTIFPFHCHHHKYESIFIIFSSCIHSLREIDSLRCCHHRYKYIFYTPYGLLPTHSASALALSLFFFISLFTITRTKFDGSFFSSFILSAGVCSVCGFRTFHHLRSFAIHLSWFLCSISYTQPHTLSERMYFIRADMLCWQDTLTLHKHSLCPFSFALPMIARRCFQLQAFELNDWCTNECVRSNNTSV